LKPFWLANVDWRHEVTFPEGSFRWGRLEDDFIAEWPDVLVLRTSGAGVVEEIWTGDGIRPSWIEKLKRGAAAAFVRAVRGGLSWHAAAVACSGEGLLLLGDSGAGKSTVAYGLCEGHGAALLADDVAAVDAVGKDLVIEPTERVVWLALHSDSPGAGVAETPKAPRSTPAAVDPAPLVMCVFLGFDDSLGIRSRALAGVEGFERLLAATLRFIPSPEQWRRELDAIARIFEAAMLVEVIRGRSAPAAATAEYVMSLKQRKDSHRLRLRGTAAPSKDL
jgi:hypothetical protein